RRLFVGPHGAVARIDRLIAWKRRLAITIRRRQLIGLDVLRIAAAVLRAGSLLTWPRRPSIAGGRIVGRRIVVGFDRRRRLERGALLLERWYWQRQKLCERRRGGKPQYQPDNGGRCPLA